MAKSYKILVFAKPCNSEQPLVSGMPWLAVLCPLLAGNVISEIQGYVCSGDYPSAESGDQKMVTEQEMPLHCDAPPNVLSEQPHDWSHGMPSLSSIVPFFIPHSHFLWHKAKGAEVLWGGLHRRAPGDLGTLGNLSRQKLPLRNQQRVCVMLVTSSQEAGRLDGPAICSPSWPLYAQGLWEEPEQPHILASLSLSLRALRSSSAKCVKGQGTYFMQVWFSALVVLKESIS